MKGKPTLSKVKGILSIVWEVYQKEDPDTLAFFEKEGFRFFNKRLGSWDLIKTEVFYKIISSFIHNSDILADFLEQKKSFYNKVDKPTFWYELYIWVIQNLGIKSEKFLKDKSFLSFSNVSLNVNDMTTHPHNKANYSFVGINSVYKKKGLLKKQ